MNITGLEMLFRKDINYIKIIKLRFKYDVVKYKIYIFAALIVN
jgi:hypothetical protein